MCISLMNTLVDNTIVIPPLPFKKLTLSCESKLKSHSILCHTMPISAEEWRVRTGLNNAQAGKVETCPGKRMHKCDWHQSDRVFLTTIMTIVISFMISLLLMQNNWCELSLLNTLYMTIISVLVDISFADTTLIATSTSVAVTCVSSTVVIHDRNETVMRHLGIATIVLPLLLLLAGDVETNPGPETEGMYTSVLFNAIIILL